MYKKILLICVLFFPRIIDASGNKLSDGSCQFDIGTGYKFAKVYINDKQNSYVILSFYDPRYGTTKYVYNGDTCKSLTSGDSSQTNYEKIMKKNGFQKIIHTTTSSKKEIDKWFNSVTTFYANSKEDFIQINVIKNNSAIKDNLNGIVYSLVNRNVPLKLPNNDNYFRENLQSIENILIKYINSTKLSNINYNNFFMLIKSYPKLSNLKNILSRKIDKYIRYNISTLSDIPSFEENILREYPQYSKSYLNSYTKIKNFRKKIMIDDFLNSIEYKEFYSKVDFNMNFSQSSTGTSFMTVVSTNPFKKVNLQASSNNFDVIRKTETKIRKANTLGESILGFVGGLMNGNIGNNQLKTQISHVTLKPKHGYLDKMRNIIISLNPKNKNALLNYLQNKTEWHFSGKENIVDAVYIAPPPPTQEEIERYRELDRVREMEDRQKEILEVEKKRKNIQQKRLEMEKERKRKDCLDDCRLHKRIFCGCS